MDANKVNNPSNEVSLTARGTSPAGWVILVAVLAAALSSMGAAIALIHPAALVSSTAEINVAARIYAGYFASRSMVIALLLWGALATRRWGLLSTLMTLAGLIQLADFVIDCAEGRWAVTPGVLVLSALFLVAAARLSDGKLWQLLR